MSNGAMGPVDASGVPDLPVDECMRGENCGGVCCLEVVLLLRASGAGEHVPKDADEKLTTGLGDLVSQSIMGVR